jgi:hypothetical protein
VNEGGEIDLERDRRLTCCICLIGDERLPTGERARGGDLVRDRDFDLLLELLLEEYERLLFRFLYLKKFFCLVF